MSIALKLENISKNFGSNQVLDSVNLQVNAGEIHGLVGENGSGKSTLLNILIGNSVIWNTGGYQGNIFLEGQPVEMQSPRQAVKAGVGMVHQEFTLLPGLTVGQNINLGRENLTPSTRKLLGQNLAFIDQARDHAMADAALKRLGVNLNPRVKPGNLSVSLKQYVELARETSRKYLRVLILDEPTATLGTEDMEHLISVLRELASQGTAVVFVSHRLEEVLALCDRITVLRDGKVAGSFARGAPDFRLESVTQAMIGQGIVAAKRGSKRFARGSESIRFEDFTVDMPGETIRKLNLKVYRGEILGVSGLSGHGKLALGYGIMGIYPTSGRAVIDGRVLNPRESMNKDLCFLPDDRRQAGLLLGRSIAQNIVFTAVHQQNKFLKFSLGPLSMIDRKSSIAYAEKAIKRFDIRCRSVYQKVGSLSGGNQQKVCLARAVAAEPRVLFVAEPTRGVDINAKQMILEALIHVNREQGTTIVCASSEIGDLKQICDRIVVMHEGEVFGEFPPDTSDSEFALAFSGKRTI
ncbi:MAG: sugar ABC transporter ATP-binding protein [Dehalococcoidia bacterium]|nr:sugar ABC transporter ATP-binding protein [Dehalococcoidia bacterium]